MNLEAIRAFCLQLPHVTEGIKWENDMCFMLADKMFCVTGLTEPFSCSFKCSDEDFGKLIEISGIIPAPYMARNKWVNIQQPGALTNEEWKYYIGNSYQLIRSKLPKKVQNALGS
jgi:predicted DNA-binding protein (MmcQ/YjbR family)